MLVSVLFTLLIQTAQATILPPNDLHLEDDPFSKASNITEAQFRAAVTKVVSAYAPVVAAHGARLVGNATWQSSTVNAFADQDRGVWSINFFGGLARRPEISLDGFTMVACHELGHHLAGFPFIKDPRTGILSWASSEGEADYFASQVCARRIFKDEPLQNAAAQLVVGAFARNKCDSVWSAQSDRDLCYRIEVAAEGLSALLGRGGVASVAPRPQTPDRSLVRQTFTDHPAAQCRLDTYFAGALCPVAFDESLIPGKNHPQGQGSQAAEWTAVAQSCATANGYTVGVRPRCWFKPGVRGFVRPEPWPLGSRALRSE